MRVLLCLVLCMPSAVYEECHNLALYAESHDNEWHHTKCHHADCRHAKNMFSFLPWHKTSTRSRKHNRCQSYKNIYGANLSGAPVKHLSGAPLWGRPLVLPTDVRLGFEGLIWTNTLSYYKNP